jgi:muramidase (phage lysozyme)
MSWWQESTPVGDTSNLTKFLSFLSQAEGADYNTIVGGSRFNSFDAHPGVVGLRTKEGPSTAAGRYQITKTTYDDVAPRLGIKDFSPQSQDAIAIELIRRGKAYDDVVSGNFESAINKLGSTWASLPSSPYSQPKKSWADVNKMLGVQVASNNASNNWWAGATPVSDSPSGDNWWSSATPAQAPAQEAPTRAPTQAAPQPAKVTPPAKPKTRVELALEAAQGAGDALTFGFLDEIAGKGASMLGFDGNKVRDNLRQRAKDAGPAYTAGQVGGAFVPGLGTVGAIRAVPTAGRLLRGVAGAGTGAVQGGLYGAGSAEEGQRLEGAATGAAISAATGGVLGGVLPASQAQKTGSFIKKSGDNAAARLDAEIITDIKKIADSQTKRGNPVSTIDLNAVEGKYINEVNRAVASLSKVDKKFDAAPLKAALQDRRALTPDDLAPLRTTKAGEAVADAIEKAQRARSLTQAMQSSGGVLPLMREGVDLLPLPAAINRGVKAMLGGRQTREVAAQNVLKQADTAQDVLGRLGPSQATQSMQGLNATVERALKARQAQADAAKAAAQGQAAQNAATKLQVLKDTRRPLSGAFQELLPGGASNLNLSSKEAIDALRLVSRQQKDGPVGTAAMEILRSGNVANKDAFYGLQNQLRKLQEQGVLAGQPGALTAASSGVRNPVSYAEAVRTAGEAANLARANAPSKELAQFATKVAGIKAPADKAKAVADRLAKSSDPAEQAFLTQFVEPLTQFGKK